MHKLVGYRSTVAFFTLLLAFGVLFFLKQLNFWTAAGFEKDKRTFFWTESAMHYYMAQKVAAGESLSEVDRIAQHPEGIPLSTNIAPAMPWIAGKFYSLLDPDTPLDIFIVYLSLLYSSLTVFAIYLWSKEIFESQIAGLAAALLYSVSCLTFIRTSGGYIKEDLAYPCIFLSVYLLFSGLRRQSYWRAGFSSVLMSVALLSWHFTQFVLLTFAGALFLNILFAGLFSLQESRRFYFWLGGITIVCLLAPMLMANAFVVSPAMAILYSLC